jgi:hypothetical protein
LTRNMPFSPPSWGFDHGGLPANSMPAMLTKSD